ncbi:MAG: Hpt domain-containing protein [Spirochaetaceae bacterium]|nr:Hpt domain-containing protein [Spirochaetaceae bacterium]|tara:strand:- start:362682 stop:362987 length:306 start_codon:yes stop_codon:yes gene_type:complete
MKVEISKDLEDLIPGYLDGIRKTIQDFKGFLENQDWDSLRVQGHRMKGSGGGYGFHFLTEKGKQIEDSAKDQNGESIKSAIDELDQYMESLEVVFVESEDW